MTTIQPERRRARADPERAAAFVEKSMVNPSRPSPGLEKILALAFGCGDGAYAWKKEVLPEVLDALAAAGLAVVGGAS